MLCAYAAAAVAAMASMTFCSSSASFRLQNPSYLYTLRRTRAVCSFSRRQGSFSAPCTPRRREISYGGLCCPRRKVLVRKAPSLVCKAQLKNALADFRPGSRAETDSLPSSVRDKTIKAIDNLGGRVTVGDVAGAAGLKLDEAERALQAIAADSSGFLEVSDEGDVIYVFPSDYKVKLAAKSLKIKFEPLISKSKAVAEYLIRVSFGTALVVSIVIVYTAIIAILSGKSDDERSDRRDSYRRSYNSGFNIYISPADLFWYWDPYYYRRQRRKKGEMNFFESVFSFVFGDGDPNEGIEEERWKLIGEYITSNGGVVTAEELAPYLDPPSPNEEKEDESYVLPVLLRFDGHPEVDDNGNILYQFPSLQRTTSSSFNRKRANWFARQIEYIGTKAPSWVEETAKMFKERRWDFSKADPSQKTLVVALGALNFAGVIYLGNLLRNIPTIRGGGFLTFVGDIFPLLQIYAASFFAIPLCRWLFLVRKNADIDERNRAREARAFALQSPDTSLRQKLISARKMAQQTVIGQDRTVYSTDKDLDEQGYDAREWDRRFRELER